MYMITFCRSNVGRFGSYNISDKMQVRVNAAGKVEYVRNSKIIYTSKGNPSYPLAVDSSFYSEGAAITKVTWISAACFASASCTQTPTLPPTQTPTLTPTELPTTLPPTTTKEPSPLPTNTPTELPSAVPTVTPTTVPTTLPPTMSPIKTRKLTRSPTKSRRKRKEKETRMHTIGCNTTGAVFVKNLEAFMTVVVNCTSSCLNVREMEPGWQVYGMVRAHAHTNATQPASTRACEPSFTLACAHSLTRSLAYSLTTYCRVHSGLKEHPSARCVLARIFTKTHLDNFLARACGQAASIAQVIGPSGGVAKLTFAGRATSMLHSELFYRCCECEGRLMQQQQQLSCVCPHDHTQLRSSNLYHTRCALLPFSHSLTCLTMHVCGAVVHGNGILLPWNEEAVQHQADRETK